MADTEKILINFCVIPAKINMEQSVLQCCVIKKFIAHICGVAPIDVTVCEPWPYNKESRYDLLSRRLLQPGSTLCEVFLALVWGTSLVVPPIPNWKQPVRLTKKDIIAAIETIESLNVLIVHHVLNLLMHSNYASYISFL